MQNNKYKSCKNTYKKHDKAHHSSSKSILSRHISDPVYIQELYRNITIYVSSSLVIPILTSPIVLPILINWINLIESNHHEREFSCIDGRWHINVHHITNVEVWWSEWEEIYITGIFT